jgi:hypothetical protein
LRRLDSNQRPSGYEPDELPLLHSALASIPKDDSLSPSGERARVRGKGRSQCALGDTDAEGLTDGLAEGDGDGDGEGLGGVVTRYSFSFGFA